MLYRAYFFNYLMMKQQQLQNYLNTAFKYNFKRKNQMGWNSFFQLRKQQINCLQIMSTKYKTLYLEIETFRSKTEMFKEICRTYFWHIWLMNPCFCELLEVIKMFQWMWNPSTFLSPDFNFGLIFRSRRIHVESVSIQRSA